MNPASERRLDKASIHSAYLTADAELEGDSIRIKLTGNADSAAIDPLRKALGNAHTEAQRLGLTEVVLELLELYFMSSACISVLIRWLSRAEGAYRIRFRCNPNLRWQRRSLAIVSQFAPGRVVLESLTSGT